MRGWILMGFGYVWEVMDTCSCVQEELIPETTGPNGRSARLRRADDINWRYVKNGESRSLKNGDSIVICMSFCVYPLSFMYVYLIFMEIWTRKQGKLIGQNICPEICMYLPFLQGDYILHIILEITPRPIIQQFAVTYYFIIWFADRPLINGPNN